MNKLSPKLVDYSLFKKKKIIKKNINPIIIHNNNNFLLNIILLLIIVIGFGLYYRYKNKDINDENNIHKIISLNQYINNNINDNDNEKKTN